jgi:hypothetical protein
MRLFLIIGIIAIFVFALASTLNSADRGTFFDGALVMLFLTLYGWYTPVMLWHLKSVHVPITISVDFTGVTRTQGGRTVTHDWKKLNRAQESSWYYWMRHAGLGGKANAFIPKSAFTEPGDEARFREILKASTRARFLST